MSATDAPARRSVPDIEQIAAKLADKSIDAKARLATAFELKELLDLFQNIDYALFLKHVIPAYISLLDATPCSFIADAPEQRLRHIILETTHRMPQHDVFKPYADPLMTAMLNVLRDDNEDNAVLALKVIIDLHRSFKAVLQDQVQPFLDLVKKLYANMKNTVEQAFESEASQLTAPAATTPAASDATNTTNTNTTTTAAAASDSTAAPAASSSTAQPAATATSTPRPPHPPQPLRLPPPLQPHPPHQPHPPPSPCQSPCPASRCSQSVPSSSSSYSRATAP